MTREEYREHIDRYSSDPHVQVMSYLVQDHPDFQAIADAEDEVIPYLLEDLVRDREDPASVDTYLNLWAVLSLLNMKIEDPPDISRVRGQFEPMRRAYVKWGERHGYLPPTADDPPHLGFFARLARLFHRK